MLSSQPRSKSAGGLFPRAVALPVLAVLTLASPAVAGPPLLCHPFDIGPAQSLPWDGSGSWFHGRAGYQLSNLVADTEALLTPRTPVIVRMETLRRAAIYASQDPKVAERLVTRLTDRATAADRAGRPDPLALLDAAYVVEAIRQITNLDRMAEFRGRGEALKSLVAGKDGYAMVKKAAEIKSGDAALEFAAALIAADKDRVAYTEHAKRARAGVNGDALLAKNIHQLG
jgi:hypothetical protein